MKIMIVMPLAEQRGGAELALLHLLQQAPPATLVVVFLQPGPMADQARAFWVALSGTLPRNGTRRLGGCRARTVSGGRVGARG